MYYIALKMLVFDTAKYLGLIFIITIATFLMAQQLSIFIAVMNRTTSQIVDVRGVDIWVMDSQVEHLEEIKPIRDIDLYRVRGVDGVKWAVPFFKGLTTISYPDRRLRQAFIYGVDDESLTGQVKVLYGNWENLRQPKSVIIDIAGWRLLFGKESFQYGRKIQVNDQNVEIVGIADPLPPFFSFPLLYSQFSQARKLAPQGRNSMSFILVKVADSFSPEQVATRISRETGLQALTVDQFKWRSINYVLLHTPIPVNFALTVGLGFLIGTVVVGQTFYLFLLENLPQFGLLKAIGVSNKQIMSMIFLQAVWIALIGFGIGIGLCALFSEMTSILFMDFKGVYVPWQVILVTGVCVLVIILIAIIAGTRKVLLLNPDIVFRG